MSMKRIVSILLIIVGLALVGSVIYDWIKPNVDQEVKDVFSNAWTIVIFLLGVFAEIKGIRDLFSKDKEKISIDKIESGAQVSFGKSSKNIKAEQYIENFYEQPDSIAALSRLPLTIKAGINIEPIGREKEISFLKSVEGDVLVVGQPGSGKTFLFYQLAKDGLGLFLCSTDSNKVIREYKEKKPLFIFADDAQIQANIINDLIRFRVETNSQFYILASCWPNSKDKILQILNIPKNKIITLDLLTRDEIVQVIERIGLKRPDFLIQEIVNQAVGRPGLAITLADMCLKGDAKDVYFGEILTRTLSRFLQEEVGEKSSILLAAFALGGDGGMSVTNVSAKLGLDLSETMVAVTKLASSGILYERSIQLLSVYPAALREILVRDTFFGDTPRLQVEPFLEISPDLKMTCLTLIGARARGGNVPVSVLLEMLQSLDHAGLWKAFAYIGKEEAHLTSQLIKSYDNEVFSAILENAPEDAIPVLLKNAFDDNRPLNAHPEHGLRIIEDWVKSAEPGSEHSLRNRKVLLNQIQELIHQERLVVVCIRALRLVMSLDYQELRQAPGSGNRVNIFFGALTFTEVKELEKLWAYVKGLLISYGRYEWGAVKAIVEMWAYPGRHQRISEEAYNEVKAFSVVMLQDLFPLLKTKRGYLHWANHLSRSARLKIAIDNDKNFEILYPWKGYDFSSDERKDIEKRQAESVINLVEDLLKLGHNTAIKTIAEIEEESQLIGHTWYRWTPYLCSQLAARCESPFLWLSEGVRVSLRDDLITPFLIKSLEVNSSESVEFLYTLLENSHYKNVVIYLALVNKDMPSELLNHILVGELESASDTIETACIRDMVPESTLILLLTHPNKNVVKAATVGMWQANSGQINEALIDNWKQGFVMSRVEEYLLKDVLSVYPDLAEQWLQTHAFNFRDNENFDFELGDSTRTAVSFLSQDARKNIINKITDTPYADHFVISLVNNNLDLYADLLSKTKKKNLALTPLYGEPSENWISKAKIALSFGYSHKDIAYAMRWLHYGVQWMGEETKMWAEWIEKLEPYSVYEDEDIQRIIQLALEEANRKMEQALVEQRKEDVFGRG